MASRVTIEFGANMKVFGLNMITSIYDYGYFYKFKNRFTTTRYDGADMSIIMGHKLLVKIKELEYEL
jgi:hypothetical protein